MKIRIIEVSQNEVKVTKIENIKDIHVYPYSLREMHVSYRLKDKEYKEVGDRERIVIDTFNQTIIFED